jgi:hypothetical protein
MINKESAIRILERNGYRKYNDFRDLSTGEVLEDYAKGKNLDGVYTLYMDEVANAISKVVFSTRNGAAKTFTGLADFKKHIEA